VLEERNKEAKMTEGQVLLPEGQTEGLFKSSDVYHLYFARAFTFIALESE
jgi:hypothetical protein